MFIENLGTFDLVAMYNEGDGNCAHHIQTITLFSSMILLCLEKILTNAISKTMI